MYTLSANVHDEKRKCCETRRASLQPRVETKVRSTRGGAPIFLDVEAQSDRMVHLPNRRTRFHDFPLSLCPTVPQLSPNSSSHRIIEHLIQSGRISPPCLPGKAQVLLANPIEFPEMRDKVPCSNTVAPGNLRQLSSDSAGSYPLLGRYGSE